MKDSPRLPEMGRVAWWLNANSDSAQHVVSEAWSLPLFDVGVDPPTDDLPTSPADPAAETKCAAFGLNG